MIESSGIVEIAVSLARRIHRNQKQKYGGLMIDHVQRVGELCEDDPDEVVAAAWLHDSIEDGSPGTEELLERELCPFSGGALVLDAVRTLTRRPGTTYGDYIDQLVDRKNWIARPVKVADLIDHLTQENPCPESLRRRYTRSLLRFA